MKQTAQQPQEIPQRLPQTPESSFESMSLIRFSQHSMSYLIQKNNSKSSFSREQSYYRDVKLENSKNLFKSGNSFFDNLMKKLFFNNHALMEKYKYIAKHKFDRKHALKAQKGDYEQFTLIVEKGEPNFILDKKKQNNDYYVTLLLEKQRPSELLFWLQCLVSGIIELERAGIYHADLLFRNTIKIKIKNKEGKEHSIYKIIDFDYSFKTSDSSGDEYEKYQQQAQLIINTKKIIQLWLKADQWTDIAFFQCLFRKENEKRDEKLLKALESIKYSSKDLKQKIVQVMKHLNNHKSHSHLWQLSLIIIHLCQRQDVSDQLQNCLKQMLQKIDKFIDFPEIREENFIQIKQILKRNTRERSLLKSNAKHSSKSEKMIYLDEIKVQIEEFGYHNIVPSLRAVQRKEFVTDLFIKNTAYWFETLDYLKNIDEKVWHPFFSMELPKLASQLSKFTSLEVLTLQCKHRLLDWSQFDHLSQVLNQLPKLKQINLIMTSKSLFNLQKQQNWTTKFNSLNKKIKVLYQNLEIKQENTSQDDTNYHLFCKVKEI